MHNNLLFEARTPTDIIYKISVEEGRILYITVHRGVHVEHFLKAPHGHAGKLTKSIKNEAAKALGETNREKFEEMYEVLSPKEQSEISYAVSMFESTF